MDRGMCDACLLGMRYQLHYECQRCHKAQQIPHPMWRYQETPLEFGNITWACHRDCGDYTHWRVIPEDAAKVPDFDCPDGWGRRDDWLATVRRQRHMELSASIRRGTLVTIRGLKSQPQHNGQVGEVVGTMSSSGRVSVQLPGLQAPIALKPVNITQHVQGVILAKSGSRGSLLDFEDESSCYRIDVGGCERMVLAEDMRLPPGTVARVVGLASDQGQMLNDRLGRIVTFEEESKRYVVDLGDGRRKLKPVNMQP